MHSKIVTYIHRESSMASFQVPNALSMITFLANVVKFKSSLVRNELMPSFIQMDSGAMF